MSSKRSYQFPLDIFRKKKSLGHMNGIDHDNNTVIDHRSLISLKRVKTMIDTSQK